MYHNFSILRLTELVKLVTERDFCFSSWNELFAYAHETSAHETNFRELVTEQELTNNFQTREQISLKKSYSKKVCFLSLWLSINIAHIKIFWVVSLIILFLIRLSHVPADVGLRYPLCTGLSQDTDIEIRGIDYYPLVYSLSVFVLLVNTFSIFSLHVFIFKNLTLYKNYTYIT